MSSTYPVVSRTYRNHHLDSTRWESWSPRPDDIVIVTSLKSGTTWTQSIVRELVVLEAMARSVPAALLPLEDNRSSIWPDASFAGPVAHLRAQLEGQAHRRFLKTHLPLDGLPYDARVRYVVVGRDPRDVFMSLWNHYSRFTPDAFATINRPRPGRGEPCPPCPPDIHDFWQSWMTRGWFPDEREGFPFWGNLHHARSWWEQRHQPNIELFHYADLLDDPHGEVARLARFLEIGASAADVEAIVARTDLGEMRERNRHVQLTPALRDGARGFFFKGSNGRWRDVLSAAELELYESAKAQLLPAGCIDWLERGCHDRPSPSTQEGQV